MASCAILDEALRLSALGYTTVSVNVMWDGSRKKLTFPSNGWQKAEAPTAASHPHVLEAHNGLAMITGRASDVLVVDADPIKPADGDALADGIAHMQACAARHGLPDGAPLAATGSGGRHYLFSLSKSVADGLDPQVPGRTKLTLRGVKASVDTRIGGNCIICAPTAYHVAGGTRTYRWLSPLTPAADLPPAPAWLIADLNVKPFAAKRQMADTGALTSTKRAKAGGGELACVTDHFTVCQPLLEKIGFVDPVMTRAKERGFDFVADRTRPCSCCKLIHDSNEWYGICLFDSIFSVRSYSQRCKPCVVGFEAQQKLQAIMQAPLSDEPYADVFATQFGLGSPAPLIWTGQRWLHFRDHRWRQVVPEQVRELVQGSLASLLEQLARWSKGAEVDVQLQGGDAVTRQQAEGRSRTLLKAITHVKRMATLRNIVDSLHSKMLTNVGEHPSGVKGDIELDGDPHLLGCENGVIDLKTCQLRPGKPEDWVSKSVGYAYEPSIEAISKATTFFDAVYPQKEERGVMQKWFGYNLLGHAPEKRLCLLTDERDGDNGKSSVLKALGLMLGAYARRGKNSFLYKAQLDSQTANSHDAGLLAFRGYRAAVFEELDGSRTLDGNLIKTLTNGVGLEMTARGCGAAAEQQFDFTAKLTLAFNQGQLPDFRVDDQSFQKRPFSILHRAVFCGTVEQYERLAGQPHTHLADDGLHASMPAWASGVLHWALEGLERYRAEGFRDLPQGVRDFGRRLLGSKNLVAEWIRENVVEAEGQYLPVGEMAARYMEDVGQRITAQAFRKLAVQALPRSELIAKKHNHKNVFGGLQLRDA